MAEGKKSFIAYADWKEVFDALPNEDAGALIKHIFAYVNDENPTSDSVLIKACFAQIKNTLKRDLDKWETQLEQRRKAGKKSAEIRSTKSNDRSTSVQSRQRNPTDSVSVSDNVNDINKRDKSLTVREQKEKFLSWFNSMKLKHTGKEGLFKTMTTSDVNNLKELKRFYTLEEFERAFIAMTKSQWVIDNNKLTVNHFLINDNFQKYVNTPIDEQPKFKAAWQ